VIWIIRPQNVRNPAVLFAYSIQMIVTDTFCRIFWQYLIPMFSSNSTMMPWHTTA